MATGRSAKRTGEVHSIEVERSGGRPPADPDEWILSALEGSRTGAWRWEPRTDRMDWSPGTAAMHGLPSSFGGTFDEFHLHIHPDDRERVLEALRRSLADSSVCQVEYRTSTADGEERWLEARGRVLSDSTGEPAWMAGVCLDITGRKRVAEALREGEERFRSLADSAPLLIWMADPDRKGIYFNRAWLEFTGRDLDEELGDGWWESVHPEDRSALEDYGESYRAREPFTVQYRLRRRDGAYRWIHDTGTPRFDPDGTYLGFTGTCVDITELQEVEQALRKEVSERTRAEEELQEAHRRKDEFLAMLSHELRNPLAPVRTCLSLLEDERLPEERRVWARRVIDRQTTQLVRLVDDLLDVSRITRGKIQLRRERIDLVELVRSTLNDHAELLRNAELELVKALPEAPVWIQGDATRLAQAFGNLLSNTVKFTPAGGRVWVELTLGTGAAQLSVRDNGIGMDDETLERIFEPFTRSARGARGGEGGLGLGLSLAAELVRRHGGEMRAASDGPDLGSKFTVRLPLAASPDVGSGANPPRSPAEALPGRRILVIEDNPDFAESLRVLLEARGHDVAVSYDGESGLAAARRFRPHVVLCDLALGRGTDGYDVVAGLRGDTRLRGTLMVAVTGYGQPGTRRWALEAGFDDVLIKPIELRQLERILALDSE